MRTPSGPIGVVLNPVHPRAERALNLVHERTGGAPVLVRSTTSTRPGRSQALELTAAGVRRLLVLGGDGTAREVVAGLLDAASRTEATTRDAAPAGGDALPVLGVVPTGTGNLLATNLLATGPRRARRDPRTGRDARRRGRTADDRGRRERSGRLSDAVDLALTAPGSPLDVGVAHLSLGDTPERREVFTVMAGFGRDAQTVALTGPRLKHRLGVGAYALSAARTFRRPPLLLHLGLDGEPPRPLRSWTVLAGNLPLVPGGVPVFPGARPDDGLLRVLTVGEVGWRDWAGAALVGARGALQRRRTGTASPVPGNAAAALTWSDAEEITLSGLEPLTAQFDGDVVEGVTAARVTILPSAVRVAARA